HLHSFPTRRSSDLAKLMAQARPMKPAPTMATLLMESSAVPNGLLWSCRRSATLCCVSALDCQAHGFDSGRMLSLPFHDEPHALDRSGRRPRQSVLRPAAAAGNKSCHRNAGRDLAARPSLEWPQDYERPASQYTRRSPRRRLTHEKYRACEMDRCPY